jgi:uncharacterized protein
MVTELKNNKFYRRDFLKTVGLYAAGIIALTTGLLVVKNESEQPVVDVVEVPIQGLPEAFEGFTIAQLSDIHLYPYTQAETVQKAVELANQFQPDLVALTGDYVWQDLDAIFDLTPIFSNLQAKYGVVAIMGNHDIWLDATTIKSAFAEAGLPMLVNQGFPIQKSGTEIYIAGLDDGWSGQPDLNYALADAKENIPVILLFHEPDLVDQVSLDGRVSLMLSGHTHGGQVRINGKRPPIQPYLGTKYDIGLHQVGSTYLYVNRGIGNISIPLRINCPPEVTRLILRNAG